MEQCNSTHQRRKCPGVLNLFSRQNGKWRVVKFGPGSWLWALPGSLSGGLRPCCGPRFSRAGPEPGLPRTWLSEGRRVIPHQDWMRILDPEFPEGSQSASNSCPPGPLPSDICAEKPTAPEPPPPQVNWGARACNTYNKVSVALANFNYECICSLIFPRWFDFKKKNKNPNYKGTDCTVAFCRR